WAAVGYVLTTLDPRAGSDIVVVGALLLGTAITLTVIPVLWIAAFARRHIAYRGAWIRAVRRGALGGLVVALLVILRAESALSVPMAAFVVGMPILVEVSLSVRR